MKKTTTQLLRVSKAVRQARALLCLLLFLCSAQALRASDFTIYYTNNGIRYFINYDFINDGTEVEVSHGYVYDDGDLLHLSIPETVEYEGKLLSVTSIAKWAISHNSYLASITIPKSVTNIGESPIIDCSNLTSIIVDKGNTVYDSRDNCNAIIETASNTLIEGCKGTVIPESVTSIGDGAFYSCESLTSITIPESVTSIANSAFSGSGLTSVTIPDGVTSIGDAAFSSCEDLTSVIIPESVTSIGQNAFSSCGLTSITIPKSVTSIGMMAFSGCSSLTSVYSWIETPFYLPLWVFRNIADDATLYVPQGTKDAYERAGGWTDYFSRVVEFDATGIAATPATQAENDAVYNLNGMRVDRPTKGIYIKNGKKVAVK